MSKDDDSRMASYLKDHPKMLGAAVTLVLLLTQAGTVVAGGGTTCGCSGP